MKYKKMINKIQFIEYLQHKKTKTTDARILKAINYILNELNLYYSDFDLFGKKAITDCFKSLQDNKNKDYILIIWSNLGV